MSDFRSPANPSSSVRGMGWPLAWAVVYLVTGLIGVWAAYDRQAAWLRLELIAAGMLLALVVAWIGRRSSEQGLAWVGLGCALLAAALSAYFLLTFDWQARGVAKVPILYDAGLWLQAHRPLLPAPEDIHLNVAGGGLVLMLPLGAGAIAWAWRRWPWPLLLVGCAATLLALAGLLLTVSRGAWLGLATGIVLAAYLLVRSRSRRRRLVEIGLLVVLLFLVAAVPYLAMTGSVAAIPALDASTSSRPQLWRWGLDLIADYPFTGSGLGSTMMVHATYVKILHVGFISHMHNLAIQIAVEQGLPGLIAFAALVVLAIASLVGAFRARRVTGIFAGSVAALTALLIHGIVDAGVYASLAAPLIYLPIGFALGLAPARRAEDADVDGRVPAFAIAGSAVATLLLALLLLPASRSAFLANMGAVAQTRAELSVYEWPKWGIQDALRRSPDVDLDPAIYRYLAALSLNPANAVANRRLGQIELSRGEYDAAWRHLAAAYRAAPSRQATRFLLGESLAIAGQVDQAAALWQGVGTNLWWPTSWIDNAVILGRRYWYGDALGEKQSAEWLAQAAELAGQR